MNRATITLPALVAAVLARPLPAQEKEVTNAEFTQAWFICFAPVEEPRMAVAVTIPNANGQGGTVAAPIAKSVLEALLGGGAG